MHHLISDKLRHNKSYRQLKFLLAAIVALLVIGTVGYAAVHGIGVEKSFGMTIDTLALSHQGPADSPAKPIQMFLMLFGVILFWFALWAIFDLILEGKFSELWRDFMVNLQTGKLKDHYIICGAGRVGIHVAELLTEREIPCVIIEKDSKTAEALAKRGFIVINNDALEEESLKEAEVEKAKAIVAVIPETEKNILIALLSRQLNPKITVFARAEKENMIKQLHHAGAKHVVAPEVAGAREIVSFILHEEIPISQLPKAEAKPEAKTEGKNESKNEAKNEGKSEAKK